MEAPFSKLWEIEVCPYVCISIFGTNVKISPMSLFHQTECSNLDVDEHHGYLEHERLLDEHVLDEEAVAVGDAEEDKEAPHAGEEAGWVAIQLT